MNDSDRELANRSGAGDLTALEQLYRRYVDRVWRYGWLRTRCRDAAAEIVQETFLKVARSIGEFDGRSSLGTWLFTVTRSVAIDFARREGRARYRSEQEAILRIVPSADHAQNEGGHEETRTAVRKAVAKLPGAQRDAIVLYELSGLSIRETAGVLGWHEARLKTTLFRARRKLRDLLKDQRPGETAKGIG